MTKRLSKEEIEEITRMKCYSTDICANVRKKLLSHIEALESDIESKNECSRIYVEETDAWQDAKIKQIEKLEQELKRTEELSARNFKRWLESESVEKDRDDLIEVGKRFLKSSLSGGNRYVDGVGFEFQELLATLEGRIKEMG